MEVGRFIATSCYCWDYPDQHIYHSVLLPYEMNSRNQERIHDAREVFTPTTPARLTFVERDSINNKLVGALRTPGKQIVVYGYSGSGKTTLLENKLHQIYERHITTRCITGLTFDQLVLDAFDQLGPYFISEKGESGEYSISSGISAEYLGIKSQIGSSSKISSSVKQTRILPPQLTPQALGRFMGEADCAWILEDFHKIEDSERVRLAQVMKVFMDMADSYRNLKIIALGAVDTARLIVEADSEMKNRLSEIQVPLMNNKEILEIINKGSSILNIYIKKSVKQSIANYSNGLASVCHQICLNICFASDVNETQSIRKTVTPTHMQEALKMYLDEASDTLKSSFDKAFRNKRSRKFDNTKIVLSALSRCDRDGATFGEVHSEIKKKVAKYPSGNLTKYLKELQDESRGSIVRHDTNSGRYSFTDPIYRAYAMSYFAEPSESHDSNLDIESVDLSVLFSKLIERFEELN